MDTAAKIAVMKSLLIYLTNNYEKLDIGDIRSTRDRAMQMGLAICEDSSSSREHFQQAYDLVIELDRVGEK